jgi:osmoprotectant transport system ATP-binding protein
MLELRNVSKTYGPAVVLQPTSLTFEAGRTTALIGPSGCGKSTLLRIIAGMVRPDSGEVLFEQTPLTAANAQALRQRMGYVLQDGGLFPHLTARDNVAILARHLRWNEDRIGPRMEELRKLVRLPDGSLTRYPAQLSGGQRQRVALMRALMLDPPLILLDEPMGALDPLVRFELQEDLRQAFKMLNKTVILVTHDMGEASFLGDWIVLLGEGRIVQQGTIEALVQSPADQSVTRFLNAQRLPMVSGSRGIS